MIATLLRLKIVVLLRARFVNSKTRIRLVNGAVWSGLASAASRLFTIIGSFFLARFLGQEGFGEYGVVNSTAAMISGMAGLGIGTTVVKYVAELKRVDPLRAGRILALSSVVTFASAILYGGAYLIFANWLAAKTLAAPHLAPLLKISAITVAFGVINSVQSCSLVGVEQFSVSSVIQITCSLFQTIAVIAASYLWQVTGAVAALAASMILTVVITRAQTAKVWKSYHLSLQWAGALKEWRIIVNYSLPAFLGGLSVGPVIWCCNALLANRPDGYAQLGVFNAANQWQTAVQFLPALLGTAALPIMAERYGQGDYTGSVRIMLKMMLVNFIVIGPICTALCLCSVMIMKAYGPGFASGHWTLCISVGTAALVAILAPIAHYIAASGRMWMGFTMNLGWAICMLVASWFMVRWGAEGLAGARLVSYSVHAVWSLAFVFVVTRKKART